MQSAQRGVTSYPVPVPIGVLFNSRPETGRYQLADGFRSLFKGSLVADCMIVMLIQTIQMNIFLLYQPCGLSGQRPAGPIAKPDSQRRLEI